MAVSADANAFRVDVERIIYLHPAPAATRHLDPEGIAVTREGHMLITSEGVANARPGCRPPSPSTSSDGQFIRQLRVRPRYSPTEHGQITAGVRDNAGFEPLTMSPDYSRLFTGTELPLTQDGDAPTFAPGARSRLLEYTQLPEDPTNRAGSSSTRSSRFSAPATESGSPSPVSLSSCRSVETCS